MTTETPQRLIWLSLDPVRRCINFYPQHIGIRLEKALAAGEASCVLGADFFNATVHFPAQRAYCQTTPGQHMGRSGFKAPGFRSVQRILLAPSDKQVTVWGKRVHGEWRICATEAESEWIFVEDVPEACILSGGPTESSETPLRPWSADDLTADTEEARARSVITWQWCRGTAEVHGDLTRLSDDMWCPYGQEHSASIEAAFAAKEEFARIQLEARELKVVFTPGSTFGLQLDAAAAKERAVRRVVTTVQELLEMHRRMQAEESQISGTDAAPPTFSLGESAPPEFFCPITQGIMEDPVCTVDGHTYERVAIERWFLNRNTSPLTNMTLSSLTLRRNIGLKLQIEAWRAQTAGS